MTSANVSGVMQMQDLITRVNKLSEEIGTGVDFSAMVQKQANTVSTTDNNTAITDLKTSEIKEQPTTSYEKQKSESQAVKSQVRSEEKRTVSDEVKEKLSSDATEAETDIKEKISKTLDVSEDDVTEAMELLGLTIADLADPKNLGALVANLTGNEDPAALLVNSDFTDLVADVRDIFADYAAENDMAPGEFVEILSQMETVDTDINPEDVPGMPDMTVEAPAQQLKEAPAPMTEAVHPSLKDDAIKERTVTTDDNGEVTVSEETQSGDVKTTLVQTADSSENESSDEESEDAEQTESTETLKPAETKASDFSDAVTLIRNDQTEHTQAPVVQDAAPELPQQPIYDPQQIINDIVTQAKVAYTPDEQTEVQMVLNPEELGKLMLSVNSSKEGNITARFTVETEMAKEVLEQQMAVLRDNLNTQGVKVDAVEVTVSSHAFEENLDGEFQREQNEGENAEEQAQSRRRNINLDDLSQLGGLMSEEEMLVASIMRDNGNTVNFTA